VSGSNLIVCRGMMVLLCFEENGGFDKPRPSGL